MGRLLQILDNETIAFLLTLLPAPLSAVWYAKLNDATKENVIRISVSLDLNNRANLISRRKSLFAAIERAQQGARQLLVGRNLKFLIEQHDPVVESLVDELGRSHGALLADALHEHLSFEQALAAPKGFLADFFMQASDEDLAALVLNVAPNVAQFLGNLLTPKKAQGVSLLAGNLSRQTHRKKQLKEQAFVLKAALIEQVQEAFSDEIQEMQRAAASRSLEADREPNQNGPQISETGS